MTTATGLTAYGSTAQTTLIARKLYNDAAARQEMRKMLDEIENHAFYSGVEGDIRSWVAGGLAKMAREAA